MPSGRLLPVRYCGTRHSSSTSSAACLMSSHAVFSRPVSTCTTYHMGRPFPLGFLILGWLRRPAMVRQVAVGKRIHSPDANEHRTRCCSGHPGMVQAAAPRACRPTEKALMGFRRSVGGPDTMQKTGHRLVFHLAIIHENKSCVVKMLLYPLHLRMQCPESTCFCNKRGFM